MSTDRWHHNGVSISTFSGPEIEGKPDRRRIQIDASGETLAMDMQQWRSLVQYVRLVGDSPYEYDWVDLEYANGIVGDGILVCIELLANTEHAE